MKIQNQYSLYSKFIMNSLFCLVLILASCGMKTGILLEPPERLDVGTSSDYIEFRHLEQVNENSFEGYHIFYKIVDKSRFSYDLSTEEGIAQLVNDFNLKISSSESRVSQMVDKKYFTLYNGYGYLMTIVKDNNSPSDYFGDKEALENQVSNNSIEYRYSIRSSSNITLNNETTIQFSNFNTRTSEFVISEYQLYRHFNRSNPAAEDDAYWESFSLNEYGSDDPDLPNASIDFDNDNASYDLIILFFGFAYGFDPSNVIDTIFSEPEFLGSIELQKS